MLKDPHIDEFAISDEIDTDLGVIEVKPAENLPNLLHDKRLHCLKKIDEMEYEEEIHKALDDCICHHGKILEFCKIFGNLFCVFMIIKVSHAAFLICFAAYVVTVVSLCVL